MRATGQCHAAELGMKMSDRVDELASNVDDALLSADELENEPGKIKEKTITKVKGALQDAKDTIDEMEDAED